MTNNPYEFWLEALKDPAQIGVNLPVHENDPQSGFYRARSANGGDMIPVAIWIGKNGVVAKHGSAMVQAVDIWTFCVRHPVTEQEYRDAMDGKGWKDTPPENEKVAGIGHNMPEDPFEALTLELDGEKEIALELMKKPITNKDDADKVANFSKRMGVIRTKADELFDVEKRPIRDAGKAIDDKWRDLRESSKILMEQLKRHLDAFLKAERDRERERQRKAAEDAAIARRAADEAARKAANTQSNPDDPEQKAAALKAEKLAEAAAQAENDAKARTVSAGRTGSKVSMRTFTSAKITDFDKLLEALKDREEILELVQSLANRAAKGGVALAGMEIVTEERAV